MSTDSYQTALSAFDEIQARLPRLGTLLDLDPEHVDLMLEIPEQPGLDFDVHLNLQNEDELHLCAGSLWVEWFPCTDPAELEAYVEAVTGLVAGRFRIVEQHQGRRAVRAELQRATSGEDGWETVATWATFAIPFRRRQQRIIQNAAA